MEPASAPRASGKQRRYSAVTEKLTLSIPETAKVLGVSHVTVRKLIKERGLPCLRWDRRLVVPVHALQEWVKNQKPDEAA